MPRAMPLLLFLVFLGATVAGVLLEDRQPLGGILIAVAVAALTAGIVVSPDARASMGDRFPRTAWFLGRVVGLRWRTIGAALALGVLAIVLGTVWVRVLFPEEDLREHLRERYGTALHADRGPLLVSAELDDDWQPDDQRYTPVGVFLRYEEEIVALLPDAHGGTRIEVLDDLDGFRRYHAYVGDFWGDSYHEKSGVPRSARAVPSDDDLVAAGDELAEARRWQHVCFAYDVEIRSGERKGRLTRPLDHRCPRYVELEGWIDPNKGRFRSRGDPGEYRLGYRWSLDGDIPQEAIDAIDTPFVEMIEGATQQPRGDGSRAGKGLLECIEAMPLLALEAGAGLVPPRVEHVAESERPAEAERSDSERRAEESWAGAPGILLRAAGGVLVVVVLLLLPVALVVRLVRRLRDA